MPKNPKMAGKGRRPKEDLDTEYWVEGDGIAKVREWLREMKSDNEIAALIGVSRQTIYKWKQSHETFGTLFKVERKAAMPKLITKAFETACGYYRDEEVIDGQGRKHLIKKWFPGNAAMQQYLLKNWDPSAYRDKQELDLGGKLPVVLTSDDQIPD